ncbi:hypothetical protein CPAST_c16830 [Clostridium pasteurianum DSM 525 = ATCC 6013]|uniref:DUF4489 domain-containing protein n=1 Tax=Clostridium pasteurianum DSM 525 = ATCC 6013 TaxID=1262449 RepID=A0A0H3J761_CLOPA|nr:DUF4489 domain-containing protein [Clostridium pasteurianum]AJA47753.1 hypothetical protein CPAST_c16830 [Clostridium pasteurianum DSM 525 = ATCC 6013]AJA51741.1 hypothetical protein CLPA_c16830 [Clostridium pasteurianum DSM 525 = ATCC 6013]AOZ75051.1 hypothetical protein AQ983_08145 [Clostridium pasteurianum DSM 525 = ATCC 6013]AOZ78846.1 hypothetical protein AQ984_08135 [Clostridium pasteurianum]KRU12251.1 hypothetical protein CP6013_01498 [Clostridium pasteurianum DSM 525 = ATCC 6013]
MNSWSRKDYYYDDDCEPCKKRRKDDYDDHKNYPTIIKCGCPSSTTVPVATTAGTTFTLASLSLDTSKLKNPCIKLEFASNLVVDVAFVGTLSIQVFKLCGNQTTPIPVGPSWALGSLAALSSTTFSFFVCDCDSCFKDCCTYTVVATVVGVATVGTLNINNATLGAIATSGSGC